MHPHFSRNMGKHLMFVLQFNLEHRVGQCFQNNTLNNNRFFFGHRQLLFPYNFKTITAGY
jgi:hypothetical protein